MTTLVNVLEGKSDDVMRSTVKTFPTKEQACEFVNFTNECYSPIKKYWTYAEIVRDGEAIELTRPEV